MFSCHGITPHVQYTLTGITFLLVSLLLFRKLILLTPHGSWKHHINSILCLCVITFLLLSKSLRLFSNIHNSSTHTINSHFLSVLGSSPGPVCSACVDNFGARPVTIFSGVMVAGGLMLSAFAPNVQFLIFSYGIVVGKWEPLLCLIIIVASFTTGSGQASWS